MAWTETDFPFGGSPTPVIAGAGIQTGVQENVPTDGTLVTVTLTNAFANAITAVILTPQGDGTQALDAVEYLPGRTNAQFQIVVTGGTGTCSVNWMVEGN